MKEQPKQLSRVEQIVADMKSRGFDVDIASRYVKSSKLIFKR